ncbi:ankyrin repeat, SAM and basic leucine zipper domain-containing protein 1 isoform X2 [Hypanus sabinus]|uniref:ankyrin repeat, SAM and basic leucine zipper domain-containing protein 1 isoform X2 n=1 Tax=Hypanus sabinus TaxID=79690 RepID=UPI0028C4919B|nr:ankyrin repeat, SAM and basic leucine zipper domain-containing protein 1 isoform X2 [Hypanus sabinus]
MACVRCVPAGAELLDSDEDGYMDCDGLEDKIITAYEIKNSSLDQSSVLEPKSNEAASAFKEALSSQNVCLVEQILNSGVDVEMRFSLGWTPLMYAASIDQYSVLMAACASTESEEKVMKCVELLLSRNANPNTASRWYGSHWIDINPTRGWPVTGSNSVVQPDADLSAPPADCSQMTPLMYAARQGHTQTVILLMSHGAEVNVQDDRGYTALIWASSQGHKSTALKLIDFGADKTLKTKYGETAAEIAEKKHHSQLAMLLKVTSITSLSKKLQNMSKDEAIYKYFVNNSNTENNSVSFHSSVSAFGEMELFLSGLDLEHLKELFKENDISLRDLITMGKEDLEKIGITYPIDQQKILDAVYEMQPEDQQVAEIPMLNNFDCSAEELAVFLIKLKKHCNHLMATIQNVTKQLGSNSELRVLDLDPDKKSALICEDLVKCIQHLNKEVESLRNLLQKLQNKQERAPNRMPPVQNSFHHNGFLKKAAVILFGTGFVFLLAKVHNMRN